MGQRLSSVPGHRAEFNMFRFKVEADMFVDPKQRPKDYRTISYHKRLLWQKGGNTHPFRQWASGTDTLGSQPPISLVLQLSTPVFPLLSPTKSPRPSAPPSTDSGSFWMCFLPCQPGPKACPPSHSHSIPFPLSGPLIFLGPIDSTNVYLSGIPAIYPLLFILTAPALGAHTRQSNG